MKCWPLHSQSRDQIKKRGGRKLREGWALSDKNDDTIASVRVIGRKNARPGESAIK